MGKKKKKINNALTIQVVNDLMALIASISGMQTFLRKYWHLNHRHFKAEYAETNDLNHVVRMFTGMADRLSEKEFLDHWNTIGLKIYNRNDELQNKLPKA